VLTKGRREEKGGFNLLKMLTMPYWREERLLHRFARDDVLRLVGCIVIPQILTEQWIGLIREYLKCL
jgi:hypothetical protein